MKLKSYTLVFIIFFFSAIGCSTFKPTVSTPPVIITKLSADCDSAIANFNRAASGNIINEISTINSIHRRIPEDLKELYPKARDAWNRELGNVKSNYDKDFTASSLEALMIKSYSNWKSNWLEDYQKFFLLLTEYRYGDYPSESKDIMKKQFWIEKADCKKRMESIVKYGLISRCDHSSAEVREPVKPILLPEKIEDCL